MNNDKKYNYIKDCLNKIEILCNGNNNSRKLLYAFFLYNPYETALNIEKFGELNINNEKIEKFINYCCKSNFNYTTRTLNFLMFSLANQGLSEKEIDLNLNSPQPIPFIKDEFYQEYINFYEKTPFNFEKATILQQKITSDFQKRLHKIKILKKEYPPPIIKQIPITKSS